MTTPDFQKQIESNLREASQKTDATRTVVEVVEKFFPSLARDVRDETIHLRLESSLLEIRVKGYDDFRTFENANRNGGSLSDYSEGKPCNANELTTELVKFSGVSVG